MAVHLLNILPTTTLSFRTPFEVLFDKSPTYDHLRVFGCLCYPNLSATSPHKLAPRSSACIFLGYPHDHKGFRCLELSTNRIIISRHVIFDESIFPFSSRTSSSDSSSYSFLSPDDDPSPLLSHLLHHPSPAPEPSSSAPSSSPPPGFSPLPANPPRRASPPPPVESTHPMVTRSKAGISKPRTIFNLLSSSTSISPLPRSHTQALLDPNWKHAMDDELRALDSNGTWELVPPPPDVNIVGSKWIYRQKFRSDGSLEQYKARLVAQGFTQQPGIDYDDTFSSVVKPATICTVLSLAVSRSWPLHQLDVKNAFLHGHLSETVYMKQPPGYVNPSFPKHVCLLKKALYGLKQAPRAWHQQFASYPSLFIFWSTDAIAFLLLYVDDIVLTSSSTSILSHLTSLLSREFAMTNLGPLHFFLGISVSRSSSGLFLSQDKFVKEILTRADMSSYNAISTPTDTRSKLSSGSSPPSPIPLSIGVLLVPSNILPSLVRTFRMLSNNSVCLCMIPAKTICML